MCWVWACVGRVARWKVDGGRVGTRRRVHIKVRRPTGQAGVPVGVLGGVEEALHGEGSFDMALLNGVGGPVRMALRAMCSKTVYARGTATA